MKVLKIMKRKELKNLAKKIAEAETLVQTSTDTEAVNQAKNHLFELCGKVKTPDEIFLLDELIQEFLKESLT